jgi:hypothetical protein
MLCAFPPSYSPTVQSLCQQPGITSEDVFGSVKTEWSYCTAGKDATGSALFGSAGFNNNNNNKKKQNQNNGQRQGQGKKQQCQGQGNQDGKWCHIHQSNLHDLKECRTAIEMFGSKANTAFAPAGDSVTPVLSSVSSATGQAAFASALMSRLPVPHRTPITLTQVHRNIWTTLLTGSSLQTADLSLWEVYKSSGLLILARSGSLTALS